MPIAAHLFAFIVTYGYLAVFIGSIIEGESIILLAGLLAHEDHLSFPLILFFAFIGSVTGDMIWFLLGRYEGTRFIHRWPLISKLEGKSVALVNKKPRFTAFVMRFMYGFRHIVPFSLGRTHLKTTVFLVYNALGAVVWVCAFSIIGYLFGSVLESVVGNLRRYELVLVVTVILIVVAVNFFVGFVRYWLSETVEE